MPLWATAGRRVCLHRKLVYSSRKAQVQLPWWCGSVFGLWRLRGDAAPALVLSLWDSASHLYEEASDMQYWTLWCWAEQRAAAPGQLHDHLHTPADSAAQLWCSQVRAIVRSLGNLWLMAWEGLTTERRRKEQQRTMQGCPILAGSPNNGKRQKILKIYPRTSSWSRPEVDTEV